MIRSRVDACFEPDDVTVACVQVAHPSYVLIWKCEEGLASRGEDDSDVGGGGELEDCLVVDCHRRLVRYSNMIDLFCIGGKREKNVKSHDFNHIMIHLFYSHICMIT